MSRNSPPPLPPVPPPRDPRKGRTGASKEVSAGGVVYRLENDALVFLLIRDSYKNWGFPKGHIEQDEPADQAALREVREETGLESVVLDGPVDTIDWFFRFRGQLIHKVCHFFLMHTDSHVTVPQRTEGITACRWLPFDEARALLSYGNARDVLDNAYAMIRGIDLSLDPASSS